MMYKRYREESDAARMVGYSFQNFCNFIVAIYAKSVPEEIFKQTYVKIFPGGGRESIETTEKNIGSPC